MLSARELENELDVVSNSLRDLKNAKEKINYKIGDKVKYKGKVGKIVRVFPKGVVLVLFNNGESKEISHDLLEPLTPKKELKPGVDFGKYRSPLKENVMVNENLKDKLTQALKAKNMSDKEIEKIVAQVEGKMGAKKEVEEGPVKKGGVNKRPNTPPPAPPKGQGVPKAEAPKEEMPTKEYSCQIISTGKKCKVKANSEREAISGAAQHFKTTTNDVRVTAKPANESVVRESASTKPTTCNKCYGEGMVDGKECKKCHGTGELGKPKVTDRIHKMMFKNEEVASSTDGKPALEAPLQSTGSTPEVKEVPQTKTEKNQPHEDFMNLVKPTMEKVKANQVVTWEELKKIAEAYDKIGK